MFIIRRTLAKIYQDPQIEIMQNIISKLRGVVGNKLFLFIGVVLLLSCCKSFDKTSHSKTQSPKESLGNECVGHNEILVSGKMIEKTFKSGEFFQNISNIPNTFILSNFY